MRHFLIATVLTIALPWKVLANPNILFITVDDMNCDSIGAFGCKLPGNSPNVDKLASEGMRFDFAHVQVGNCKPSRNVMWSGRYPHTNGVVGFWSLKPDYPVLSDLMKRGNYLDGIRGKVSHSTPYVPFPWGIDLDVIDGKKQHFKDAASYYRSTKLGIAEAQKAGKPFCLVVNISDPHKPFYSGDKDPHQPTLVYKADEVPVPGFLPDHPAIRAEMALYYSSVRRADDCVGATLKALDESGLANNTVVMFLSDHGMPFPFAKTQLYHHSTRTPWVVRWPGVVKAGAVDREHMISAIDTLPTLLDISGIKHPEGLQGQSFLPLLKGEKQAGRDMVFKEYNENAGGGQHPMRGVETKKYCYLFNPWSNGKRVMATATRGTAAYRTMKKLSETDKAVAARTRLFEHRVREELYDIENDPDSLRNLIDDPAHKAAADHLRTALEAWMTKTADPMLPVFQRRGDVKVIEAYMAKVEAAAADRKKGRKKRKKGKNKKNAA